jgi:HSP20 family protein
MTRRFVWQPFSEMLTLDEAMNQVAHNHYQGRARRGGEQGSNFPIDLAETPEGYTLRAVLPGVHPDNLNIDFADNVLTIRAESTVEEAPENTHYHVREIAGGTYERSWRFPVPINGEGIEASYEQGILTLHLPRVESVKPRRIEVQTTA